MLIVTTTAYVLTYHVGEVIHPEGEVIEIQADGDELNHIYDNFKGIPWSNRRVVIWRGNVAQFIIDNWK